MGRNCRIVIPGIPHHVTQRGVRRMTVFFDDSDRESYLRKMASKAQQHGVNILCWCLMPNHVHLIMVPTDENGLTLAVGRAHWAYVKDLNERHSCSGRLFQGRFYSTPMDACHSLNAIRYVLQNPVRAGFVAEPELYRWSSARYHLGLAREDPLVTNRDTPMVLDWMEFLHREAADIEDIRSCTLQGRPYGDDTFLSWIKDRTGLDFSKPRMGRPRKAIVKSRTTHEL
jgi:putative transposase